MSRPPFRRCLIGPSVLSRKQWFEDSRNEVFMRAASTAVLEPNNPFAKSFVDVGRNLLDGVLGIFVLFNGLLAGLLLGFRW